MAGWGTNTFGYLNWGVFGNAYVNVVNPNDTTWGTDSYGNYFWGGGGNLDASLGGTTVTAEVNVGWSARTWGFANWGDLFNANVTPTGNQITSNVGSVTIDAEINTGWGRVTWGYNGWGIEGTLQAEGISLSSNLGTATVDAQVNVGWSSDTWGFETWGISGQNADVTGIELSGNLGSLTVTADGVTGELTGEEATITQGDAEGFASFTAEVVGQPMTMTLQYQEAIVDPTGQELTANDGTADLDANTIAEVSATSASTWNGSYAWGSGAYGNEQITTLAMETNEGTVDPAPDANLIGIEMTATLDDVVTQGNANTGVITPIEWGEETWGQSTWGNGSYFDATGYAQAATINLGTAVLDANTIAAVTGQEMAMQEGDETVTGNALVTLTGNDLTMDEGTLKTLIWNQVNTGTAPTWRPVDTAA